MDLQDLEDKHVDNMLKRGWEYLGKDKDKVISWVDRGTGEVWCERMNKDGWITQWKLGEEEYRRDVLDMDIEPTDW